MLDRSETRDGIDWQSIYARLEQNRQFIEAGGDLSAEQVKRVLRVRAQALAKPLQDAPAPSEALELLVFSLTGERYGIEAAHVLEVVPLTGLTPVPCRASFVLGVVNYRGRILPVLDFRSLFELGGQEAPMGRRVVVVEAGGMTFGISAEDVAGTTRVGADEVAPPPVALRHGRHAFSRGVTAEMVVVVDLEALARDPRVLVNEQVV